MITFKQFLQEDHEPTHAYRNDSGYQRFKELGIQDAFDLFVEWMYDGVMSPKHLDELDKYEQAFWLINSVLPKEILDGYAGKTLFRGIILNGPKIAALKAGKSIKIYSKISSWAPRSVASEYTGSPYIKNSYGVLMRHTTKPGETIIAVDEPTLKFLNIDEDKWVVNPGEAVLSLPKLSLSPNDIEKYTGGNS